MGWTCRRSANQGMIADGTLIRRSPAAEVVASAVTWLVVGLLALWGVLAVYYSNLPPMGRIVGSALFGLANLAVFVYVRPRRRAAAISIAGFTVVLLWWVAIPPSNDRAWRVDVAVLPFATFEGDFVTVHDIRNFDYRSETDFTAAYYDKTFDIRTLKSVDLIASYWMGPAIAHTFLSFGFDGGDHVAVSIEMRKEQGEEYSLVKGFFKQYELLYLVADERDVIRLRTNYRKDPTEAVYVFGVHGAVENGRRLFLQYMHKINALREQPEFYNTLTTKGG